jgi:hypothetical protein
MPWITENEKTYWMPEVLPEPTDEHQQQQIKKKYLTTKGEERMHPGWTYAKTIAYVDDEYLFQNEGWKVIIDESPEITEDDVKWVTKNVFAEWEEVDERTLRVTYTITDFTEEEIAEYEEKKWRILRGKRDFLLSQTDWIIVKAIEQKLNVSSEVTTYRQELRDLPKTINDILKFDIKNDALWIIKPEVYFEV